MIDFCSTVAAIIVALWIYNYYFHTER